MMPILRYEHKTNWHPNQYNAPSFPPPESDSNLGWNRTPPLSFPGQVPPFQSAPVFRSQRTIHSPVSLRANHQPYVVAPLSSADRSVYAQGPQIWPARQGFTEERPAELSQLTGHQQQSENAPVTNYTYWPAFQGHSGNNVASSLGEGMGQSNPRTSAHWQTTPHQPSASLLLVHPPPDYLVQYPAPHDSRAKQAFTESSNHPNQALRKLLDCILHSTFIHNQACEPRIADHYSKYVLHQVVDLEGCPPIDFSTPKQSLFTLFVGKLGRRPYCLICGKTRSSIPRTLGCVRSHLQVKPFQCDGCQSCNQKNGYAAFWSAALLRDHVDGQTMATCAKCGVKLRQGNMRRHWDNIHKYLPLSTLGHPRYRGRISTPVHITDSPEDVEELISFLLEEDDG